jgi:flagellar hook-associated protein 2
MGMDIQLDGTMQFNTASYQKAASSGLYSKLAKGLKMGFSGNGSSLDAFLTSEIDPAKGALVQQIATQQTSVRDLQKRQADLQEHLNQVQNNYITQYSALNALLFQLNSTSTSLASALAAVTNINAGK